MNTRFAVVIHILTFLQSQKGKPASSELIASSVMSNPSLIRRLLSQLTKAGLTKSLMGAGGGALLARPGNEIRLLDVYQAMHDDGEIFAIHDNPNPACPVGRNIKNVLQDTIYEAEKALENQLAKTSIADMADSVLTTDHNKTALIG